ncbi:MAG: rhomboid family intramembrane serine protease [Desulfobulbales bacterium]|nr:rhomboid family intramembrane serine protease [Desulfobulbales bacterium]
MPVSAPDGGADLDSSSNQYVTAATTPDRHQAELWTLVLLSAGIANLTEYHDRDYAVMVEAAQAERAALEIEHYEIENRNWPAPKTPMPAETGEKTRPPTVLLMGALLVFHMVTGPFSASSEWFSRGAVDSRAILEGGEWWRLITALTLHSGPGHLLGNLFIGGVIIHYLCRMFGTGLAWFMLVLTGTVANFINVAARGPGHISVGFSTAVFAAVGLLCGGQIKSTNLRSILLPLGAGVSLLAMLGSSGERTDLGAHLWGLVVGLLFGAAWRRPENVLRSWAWPGKQTALLTFALLTVWFAWARALAN